MKTKFNPNDVPSWARWIAVDESGICCAFKIKPIINTDYGKGNGFWMAGNKFPYVFVKLYEGEPPENWKDELYTWGY